MIIRKPYAFLIKHFRLIHGLLFVMLVYLGINTLQIYSFFNDYAVKHYFTNTVTLASDYVSTFMYLAALIVLAISVIIYYLLSFKKKNRALYLFLAIYSIIVFVFYIYISSTLTELIDNTLNVESVRAIRDISMIVLLPQIVFAFIVLSRALGFNLKKFEFKKDLEDLKIESEDNEEVEVTLGNNNYIYKRFFVKCYRYLGYFIKENKFFVTGILSVAVLAITITVYLNIKVYNVKYNTGQEIYANTMYYKVIDSYVTNKSINGKVLDSIKSYVVVNVLVKNKTKNKYELSSEAFRLFDGVDVLVPKYNLDKDFTDFGKVFSPMTVNDNSQEDLYVVFELDNDRLKNEYLFKISNLENMTYKASNLQYSDIIITPTNIDEVTEGTNYNLNTEISFDNTILKNTKLNVYNYSLASSYKDSYDYCLNKTCYDKTFIASPSNSEKNMILKLTGKLSVDSDIYMFSKLKNFGSIFDYFGMIQYRYMGVTNSIKLSKVAVAYEKEGIAYFEVPKEVQSADKVMILLSIRGKIMIINLK